MKVIVLLDNPFTHDFRVERELITLKESGYNPSLYCLKSPDAKLEENWNGIRVNRIFGQDTFDMKKPFYLKKKAMEISSLEKLHQEDHVLLHCHDQTMLHVGVQIKKKYKNAYLIYDSHELFYAWPLNLTSYKDPVLRLKSYIVRKLQVLREFRNASCIDQLITVNESIAGILGKYFHLKNSPVVLRNIPSYQELNHDRIALKKKLNIPDDHTLVVFIAGNVYIRNQNLQQVMDQLGNRDKIDLLIISGDGPGKEYHKNYVQDKGYSNIYFHEKIKPSEIVEYLSSCDIGLLPFWNKKYLSYWFALANKLFEYIMAEIPVLSTMQPEFMKIVQAYEVGVCVNPDSPDAFLNGVNEIIRNKHIYRNKLLEAKHILNWENEKTKLVALYRQLEIKIGRK